MSAFDLFRSILGLPRRSSVGGCEREEDIRGERPNEFRNPIWSADEDDDDDDFRSRPRNHFGFSVDSDPFEMHRFFEQQFDEMLKRFQSFGFGTMFGELEQPKALPGVKEEERPLWEQYLKPGYDWGSSSKQDSDVDGKIPAGTLDKFFKSGPSLEAPKDKSIFSPDYYLTKPSDSLVQPGSSTQMFGRSVTSKLVRRPDGSEEHHRTVKDSQGNEETTITRKIGDQSYSVTTKTKPNGEQECIKNFLNVDEDHLQDFEKIWGSKL